MKRSEQTHEHPHWRATLCAVFLFYCVAFLLDAPWLHEGAKLLPHGDVQEFFVRISQPFKTVSERVYADRVRRSLETSLGAWLNDENKQR